MSVEFGGRARAWKIGFEDRRPWRNGGGGVKLSRQGSESAKLDLAMSTASIKKLYIETYT